MNSTMIIARRELSEKRFVFVAAGAFLLLALIVPLMPGVRAGERVGALMLTSLGFASIFSIGLAAILGATIIGRELSDGRLSFYFSKPVPATSVWWGKLVAAAALIVICFAIIGLPAFLSGGSVPTWTATSDALSMLAIVPAISAGAFLVAHVLSTYVRSRSGWMAFDFIAAAVCGTAIWLLAQPLRLGFAVELMKRIAEIFGVFAALTIIAAGAWQIARGRTDRKRSHMELSRFLWMSLGCGLLVVAAYVLWVVSVTPNDLRADFATQSNTKWAFVGGSAKNRLDYRASFLYNIDDGRSVRVPGLQPWWASSFSSDSNIAFWVVPPGDFWMARLNDPNPRPIQTRVTLDHPSFFNVSEDGSRLLSVDQGGILSVYDVRSGDLLGSARIPSGGYWFGYFVRPDLVRIFANMTAIYEYDTARKTLIATGQLPKPTFRFNRDWTQILLLTKDFVEIRDARTGAMQRTIAGHFATAKFLRDGRIAAVDGALRIFSADGGPLRDIPLPNMRVESINDSGNGLLVLVLPRSRCAIVDISRGAVLRIEEGLRPTSPGNTGPQLLCYSHEGLVAWNPATRERRIISKGW